MAVPEYLERLLLLCGLSILAWTDWKERRIPNRILLGLLWGKAAVVCLCYISSFSTGIRMVGSSVLGFLIGGGFFFVIYWFSRGGIGAGDVKLYAVTGCFLGHLQIFAVIVWSLFGAAVWGIVTVFTGRYRKTRGLALAPFVLLAVVIVFWYE